MIKRFNQFNESLLDKMTGLSDEELFNNLRGDGDPNTLLINSARVGFLPGIKTALSDGADINFNSDKPIRTDVFTKRSDNFFNNLTPILISVYNEHFDAFKYLYETYEYEIKTSKEDIIKTAIDKSNLEVVKYLIEEQGYNISTNNYSILKYANRYGGQTEIKKYLESKLGTFKRKILKLSGYMKESLIDNLEGPNEDEYFEALKKLKPGDMVTKSIQDNFIEGVKYVIDNYIDKLDWLIILQYACHFNKNEIVQYLLDNVDFDTNGVKVVLDSSMKDDTKQILKNFINNLSPLEESLMDKLEGPSEKSALKSNPTGVLMDAYNIKNFELFRLALEHGADINKLYSNSYLKGVPLINFTLLARNDEYTKLLIDFNADTKNSDFCRLLSQYGSLDIVKYILDRIVFTYEDYVEMIKNATYYKKIDVVELINKYIQKNVTKDISKPWKPYTGVHGQKVDRFVKDYLDNMDESLLTKLEGPSEKEFDEHLSELNPEDALLKSIKNKYKKGITDSLKRFKGNLTINYIDMKKMFEVLEIDNNLKEISKVLTDIKDLYEYSYIFLFKEGLIYCYDKMDIGDTFVLENIVFDGKEDASVLEYKRKDEDLIDCIKALIDNGFNIKSISAHDLYTVIDDNNIDKLENLLLDNMSEEQISTLLEIVSNEESSHHSLFVKLLKNNPSQESKNTALKNMCQYVEDISQPIIYFFVSKLLENGAKPTEKILKKVSKLKNGDKDNLKVYNLFKKYFDI